MLRGARHVPEWLCCGLVYLGRYKKCSPLPLPFLTVTDLATRRHLLAVQCYRLYTYGHRVFSVSAPAAWNSLPDRLHGTVSGTEFQLFQATAEDCTFF